MGMQLLPLADGPRIVLDKPVILIGRHRDCDVQIDSAKVSRRHCCLAQVDGELVVRDLGSTNGVRINGKPVLQGRLAGGDRLTIANLTWQLQSDAAAEPAGLEREPGQSPDTLSGDLPIPISDTFEDAGPWEDSASQGAAEDLPFAREDASENFLSSDMPVPISDEESDSQDLDTSHIRPR